MSELLENAVKCNQRKSNIKTNNQTCYGDVKRVSYLRDWHVGGHSE